MKKIVSILLIATLSASLVSCSAANNGDYVNNEETKTTSSITDTKDEVISVTIDVLDLETESSELTNEEISNGFISKSIEGDKAVYTIKQSDYDKYISYLYETLKDFFDNDLPNDNEFNGISNISYNKNMSKIVIEIDSNVFDTSNAFALKFAVSLMIDRYHQWVEDDVDCSISIIDEKGNEIE